MPNTDKNKVVKSTKMDEILKKAANVATVKTYQEADTKSKASTVPVADKKEKGKVGRSKVAQDDKKKARQVFYSDNEFIDIEKCADEMGMDAKAFMQMCVNVKVKAMMKTEEDK